MRPARSRERSRQKVAQAFLSAEALAEAVRPANAALKRCATTYKRAFVSSWLILTLMALAAGVAGAQTVEVDDHWDRWNRHVLRIGQDFNLRAGAAVRQVVVISGNATIDGLVDRDVVVVLGKAQLSSTAIIDGSLVVAGGSAFVAPEAVVRGDLIVVGGVAESAAGFSPGGQHVVIGTQRLGGIFDAFVPWITRGLLWGRPIVPQLSWVWVVVAIVFIVYLIVGFLLHGPVRDSTEKLAAKPMTTFVTGLLVLLLAGPVCLLLAVSVIGIAVVPFVLCALFVGWIIGKVGVMRWIGRSIVPQDPDSPAQSARSFTIGFAALCLLYMVPILGFVAWTLVGVFGLGAAMLAFLAAYRQENPVPAPRHPPAAPPPIPPPPSFTPPPPPVPSSTPPVGFDLPPPATASSDLASFPRAAFLDRLAAFALDVFLVLLAYQILDIFRRDSAFFVLLLAYHIGFWSWKGTTVGGIICQLRVVRMDGAPLRFADALVRGLASIFSLAVFGLGGLWILKDPERQSWHDRIAGTYVVKVPRNYPI
jgi:uncharacterized RDD family membrane protein YckC